MSNSGYIRLIGDGWASRSAGFLAVEIITGIVVASCLFFVRSFKWTFRGPIDAIRTFLFTLSAISAVIYFIFDLTTEGEQEDDAIVSYHYYVIYIFDELFFQVAEFSILLVVTRTVNLFAFHDFANQATHRRARFLSFFLMGIVGAVSLTTYGLFAAYYAYLSNGIWAGTLVPVTIGFLITYGTVYSAASLYIFVVALLAVVRQRSKVSLLMLLVAISLLLRATFYLVDMSVEYYSSNGEVAVNVNWAVSYIYDILSIGIYLGVTAVAVMGVYPDPIPKTDSTVELAPTSQPYVSL